MPPGVPLRCEAQGAEDLLRGVGDGDGGEVFVAGDNLSCEDSVEIVSGKLPVPSGKALRTGRLHGNAEPASTLHSTRDGIWV